MRKIAFTKMHGTGNDFILVKQKSKKNRRLLTRGRVCALCDRHTGIGADGLIVLAPTRQRGRYDFTIYNADGSSAETCVNGLRCAALLVAKEKKEAVFVTLAGPVATRVLQLKGKKATVQVDLGVPEYRAATLAPLGKGKDKMPMVAIDVGNPHIVVFVKDFDLDWPQAAVAAQHQAGLPRGANVEFVRVIGRRKIELRIFERGVGPTLSSGSGSIAAFFAAMREDLVDNVVDVLMPGGRLRIKYDPQADRVLLSGPAAEVFSGEIRVE